MTPSELAAQRSTFPLLSTRTYCAQQCFGAFPAEMLDDLEEYKQSLVLRSRSIEPWVDRWQEMHGLAERVIEAPSGSVFLHGSATAAQASIAASLHPEPGRNRILTSSGDFHSTRYLWNAQSQRGFELVEVASNGPEHAEAERFVSQIDERTRIVALSLVSPRSGALLDVAPIVAAARKAGALVVLDAFQAVGVVPIRVADLDADVIVGGYHKWAGAGGCGLAFGYVRPSLSESLQPAYPGWLAHRELLGFQEKYEVAPGARRFEQGLVSMDAVYTARAGIRWLLATGIDAIRARSIELTTRLVERATERGLQVRTPRAAASRGGMICLDLEHGDVIVEKLGEQGIDIDERPGAGVRVGPHVCSTNEEADRVIDAIAEAREQL